MMYATSITPSYQRAQPMPVPKRPAATTVEPGSPVTPPLTDPSGGGLHLLCLAAGASPVLTASAPPRPPYAYTAPPPYFMPPPPTTYVVPPPPTYYAPYYHPLPVAAPPPPPQPEVIRKVKGPWRKEEDELLTALVGRFGARRWTTIAAHIPGRTGKQARERWLNQLSPDLAKRPWSSTEDRVVMDAHARLGNRWSEIAKLLKGRTDNAVKNRFNTTIRRQISQIAGQKRPLEESDEDDNREQRQRCAY